MIEIGVLLSIAYFIRREKCAIIYMLVQKNYICLSADVKSAEESYDF